MVKAISSLNREYTDALRKYCRPQKAVVINIVKDCIILAVLIFLFVLMYLYTKEIDWFAALAIIAVIWLKLEKVIKARRERRDLPRVIYDITVDGNKFIADSKRDVNGSTVKNTLHYEIDCTKLISVKEGGNFFFIETEPNSYIIIKYSDICEGTPEQLRQILQASLKEKYKIFDK